MGGFEIGVFLSTLGIAAVDEACAVARDLGFRVIQFGKLPDTCYAPSGVLELGRALERNGLSASSLCMVFDGESYADIESVRRTVGLLPEETVEDRVAYSLRCIDTAASLGIPLVTTHIGLLPSDPANPAYERVLRAVNRIATHCQAKGVVLGIETGQETAEELLAFISALDTPVGVNFDGANFIAYGTQDPISALHRLYPKTVGVHVKDYVPPAGPGLLGKHAVVGQGSARVDETIHYLVEAGFAQPLVLETYIAANPRQAVVDARAYVQACADRAIRSRTNV